MSLCRCTAGNSQCPDVATIDGYCARCKATCAKQPKPISVTFKGTPEEVREKARVFGEGDERAKRWKEIARLLSRRAYNWRCNFRSVGEDNARNIEARDLAQQELAQLRAVVDGLAGEWESLIHEVDGPKGGMRVPFHSQWASAPRLPSVMSAIRRWTRDLRELFPRGGRKSL